MAVAVVPTLRCLVLEGGHRFLCCHEDLETALKYRAPRLETLVLIGGATYKGPVRGRKSLVQDVIEMLGKESMQLSSLRTLQFGEVSDHDIPRAFTRNKVKVAGVLRACPRLRVLLLGNEIPDCESLIFCFELGTWRDRFKRSLLGPVSAGHAPYLREVCLVQPRPAAIAGVRGLQDLRESFAHQGIELSVVPKGLHAWRARERRQGNETSSTLRVSSRLKCA